HDLLLHGLHCQQRLVVIATRVLQPVPRVAFVGSDGRRGILVHNLHPRLFQRRLEISKHLNLADTLARAVIPRVKFAFERLLRDFAIFVLGHGHFHLLVFLVLTTVDCAAWHARDDRRILAAFSILGSVFLSNQSGGHSNKRINKDEREQAWHRKPHSEIPAGWAGAGNYFATFSEFALWL